VIQPVPVPEAFCMAFEHERLDVYRGALDFIVIADDTIGQLPRGRSHLADQLHRAATSIVLDIAEGAGELSKPDKRLGDRMRCGIRCAPAPARRARRTTRRGQGAARADRVDAHQAREEPAG